MSLPLYQTTWKRLKNIGGVIVEDDSARDISFSPPVFSPSPRDYVPFPEEEVSIQAPPQPLSIRSMSLVSVLLPMGGIAVGLVFSILAATGSGRSISYLFISVPMMLFSVLGGVFNYYRARKKYQNDVKLYLEEMDNYRIKLSYLASQQHRASFIPNPDIEECIERAEKLHWRLWEREPDDLDFLSIRLGIGQLPRTFAIKTPGQVPLDVQQDKLYKEMQTLIAQYDSLESAIQLPINQLVSAGIVGEKTERIESVRSMLMQIAAHHPPDQVKLVVLVPEDEEKEWDWIRWLPHLWDENKNGRYFGVTGRSSQSLLGRLGELLKQRYNLGQEKQASPVYVFVFADKHLWTGAEAVTLGPTISLILGEGEKIGAVGLFLADKLASLPSACRSIVDLNQEHSELKLLGFQQKNIQFLPDSASLAAADRFARLLAPVQIERLETGQSLPNRVTLLDVYGVEQIEEIAISEYWKRSQPHESLMVPIGMKVGNELASINLQMSAKGGFGVHALVGGTTGTGKTRFLQTMIISMCMNYRPDDVAIVLVDYKGNDLIMGMENLPHIIAHLPNLEGQTRQTELIDRFMLAIDAEIRHRRKRMDEEGIRDINEFIQSYKQGKIPKPLPHLFIVIDEFAELIRKYPEPSAIKKKFTTIAALGRSLGIHLILATQSPGNIVEDDLRDNVNTRLCLRMGSVEASRQILRRSDAYDQISRDQVGRAYMQVGNNDLFDKIQVAYSGALNIPKSSDIGEIRINEIGPEGALLNPFAAGPSQNAKPMEPQTHLDLLVELIAQTAQQLEIDNHYDFWLPPLEGIIYLNELRSDRQGWDGQKWPDAANKKSLSPVIGLLDNPASRAQTPLAVPLGKRGSLVIYGAPGSGRTTLLQTLTTSLILDHSPDDLELYLLDFGGGGLELFEAFPHVKAVISPTQGERFHRLVTLLKRKIERRRRRVKEDPKLPGIVVVLDDYQAFVNNFKTQLSPTAQAEMEKLAWVAEGVSDDVHLVVTSDSVKTFPNKLKEKIGLVIALELLDSLDYTQAVGKTYGLYPASGIPGRGLFRMPPLIEFQTALVGESSTFHEQAEWLKNLSARMTLAHPLSDEDELPDLPDVLDIDTLKLRDKKPQTEPVGMVPLGLNLSEPKLPVVNVNIANGQHYWVCDNSMLIKTALLKSWITMLADRYSPALVKFLIFEMQGFDLGSLKSKPHMLGYVTDDDQLKELNFENLLGKYLLPENQADNAYEPTEKHPLIIVVVDGFSAFRNALNAQNSAGGPYLVSLVQKRIPNFNTIVAGTAQDFSQFNNNLGNMIKKYRTGFYIGKSNVNEIANTFFEKLQPDDANRVMQPDMAFYFSNASYEVMKLALPLKSNE